MELMIGAKKVGGIWHGYVVGRELDDYSLRALSRELAVTKAERAAREIAEREDPLHDLVIVRDTSCS